MQRRASWSPREEAPSAEHSNGPGRTSSRSRSNGSRRNSAGSAPLAICYEELLLDDGTTAPPADLSPVGSPVGSPLPEDEDPVMEEQGYEVSAQGDLKVGMVALLSTTATSIVRRVLLFYSMPFRFSWRLVVSGALLVEMVLSTALFKLGIETTSQVEAENLRQELRRVIRHSQRMKERHEENLMRLDQALREKKQLQSSLRKAKEELQELQSCIGKKEGRGGASGQQHGQQRAPSSSAPRGRRGSSSTSKGSPVPRLGLALHTSVALAASSVYWLLHQPALEDLHGSYLLIGSAAAAGFCYLLSVSFNRASAAALVLSWFVAGCIFLVSLWRHGLSGTQLSGLFSALSRLGGASGAK